MPIVCIIFFFHNVFKGLDFIRVINPFQTSPDFPCLPHKSSENTVDKGEIVRNEQFFLLPQCFLPFWSELSAIFIYLKLSSANYFNMEVCKICHSGKG